MKKQDIKPGQRFWVRWTPMGPKYPPHVCTFIRYTKGGLLWHWSDWWEKETSVAWSAVDRLCGPPPACGIRSSFKDRYGRLKDGSPILPVPAGWEIIDEGDPIPQEHMEFSEKYGLSASHNCWCHPRVCHSTMTPMEARLWGGVRAFARKLPTTTIL